MKSGLPLLFVIALLGALAGCNRADPGAAPEPQAAAEPAGEPAARPAADSPAAEAPPAGQPDDDGEPVEWIIWADGDPWDGEAPLSVEFECDLMEEVPNPKYEWDFGDGNKSDESHPKHTYAKPGRFTASCKVTDPSGGVGEDSVIIDVEAPEED